MIHPSGAVRLAVAIPFLTPLGMSASPIVVPDLAAELHTSTSCSSWA